MDDGNYNHGHGFNLPVGNMHGQPWSPDSPGEPFWGAGNSSGDGGSQQNRYDSPSVTSDQVGHAVVGHLLGSGINIFALGTLGFIPTLVMYMTSKGTSPFNDQHLRKAVNSQLTWAILVWSGVFSLLFSLVALIFAGDGPEAAVVGKVVVVTGIFGVLSLVGGWVMGIVCGIIGAIQASKGRPAAIPGIRFLSDKSTAKTRSSERSR